MKAKTGKITYPAIKTFVVKRISGYGFEEPPITIAAEPPTEYHYKKDNEHESPF